ncbi:MAG TPA: NAD-dependent epimerase [Chitinophagaceae bacterium]|nr:NAD-dependent epimerase [Chitinophagaceae bacterium]
MNVLITGTAGFIGFHLANKLLSQGNTVTGIDSINDYYDVNLKYDRLEACGISKKEITYNKPVKSTVNENYTFYQLLLEDKDNLDRLFSTCHFDIVINLAAQAGVRYSLVNAGAYISSNIVGFANILECCRHHNTGHLLYASSSSVYGLNDEIPFSTQQTVDHPISLYAASKKSNELMAHVYSHLFGLPTTGMRFFSVYGTWGRPDMALYIFAKAIAEGKPIQVFNNGNMRRDFTYVGDIVESVSRLALHKPSGIPGWSAAKDGIASSSAPYKVYNIGNSSTVSLMDFITALENEFGREAIKEYMPMQPGDVPVNYADVSDLVKEIDFKPRTTVDEGIKKFVEWFRNYYKI